MTSLVVLGSNGTYPTHGRPASGYLVSTAQTTVLLDCGSGTFPIMLERGVLPDAVVITHRHGDHCLDLVPFFNYLRFERADVRAMPLIAPPGVYGQFAELLGAGPAHAFHEVFERQWVEPGDRVTVGDLVMDFGEAIHPVPTVCVRIKGEERVLAYSGDTGPGGELERLASRANLLLCEATHQGTPALERYQFHLFAREAGDIAATAGVEQLIVTHVAPTLDPAVSVAEAAEFFDGPVTHAAPGMEVNV